MTKKVLALILAIALSASQYFSAIAAGETGTNDYMDLYPAIADVADMNPADQEENGYTVVNTVVPDEPGNVTTSLVVPDEPGDAAVNPDVTAEPDDESLYPGVSEEPRNVAVYAAGAKPGYGYDGYFLSPIEPIENRPDFNEYTPVRHFSQLSAIRDNPDGKYYLADDIFVFGSIWTPIGSAANPFTGTFDGQGHIISGLSIKSLTNWKAGFFGVADNAQIRNVGLEKAIYNISFSNGSVSNDPNVGGLVGTAMGGSVIENCYFSGKITLASYVTILNGGAIGGIAGSLVKGNSIKACYNTADITADLDVIVSIGGIAGYHTGDTGLDEYDLAEIYGCYNSGNLYIESTGYAYTGGIVGECSGNAGIRIRRSFNRGGVTAYSPNSPSSCSAGGIVGGASGVMINTCYNVGEVNAEGFYAFAGGIAGDTSASLSLYGCYNGGDVVSRYRGSRTDSIVHSGGIVGYSSAYACAVNTSVVAPIFLNTRNIPGLEFSRLIGGNSYFIYNNLSATRGMTSTGKDAMKLITKADTENIRTYEDLGWDFAGAWEMPDGGGYPVFQWPKFINAGTWGNRPPLAIPAPEDTATKEVEIEFNKDYDGGRVIVLWGPALFEQVSTKYNHNMALAAAALNAASSGGSATYLYGSDGAYASLGFDLENIKYYNYNGPFSIKLKGSKSNEHCFSIASQKMVIDGEENLIIAVVFRGTESLDEAFGDAFADVKCTFYEYLAYDYFYNYMDKAWTAFNEYINQSFVRNYGKSKVKVLIAGHSLGGAAANLFCAKMNRERIYDVKNVYAYTFGALNSLGLSDGKPQNVINGYRNIYNVFNIYDTFGRRGDFPIKPAEGALYNTSKFGSVMFFTRDYMDKATGFKKGDDMYKNHVMACYVDAIKKRIQYESGNILGFLCPVDVDIYDSQSNRVGKIQNNIVDESVSVIPLMVCGDEKRIFLPTGSEYRVDVTAYGDGVMDYYIETAGSEDDITDQFKIFKNVSLTNGKRMRTEVGDSVEAADVKLYVLGNDGQPVKEISPDGKENDLAPNPGGENQNGKYQLSVTGNTGAGGLVSGSPPGLYPPGVMITVSASPNGGYIFFGWSAEGIDLSDAENYYISFTMPANAVRLTAHFVYADDNGGPGGPGGGNPGGGSPVAGGGLNGDPEYYAGNIDASKKSGSATDTDNTAVIKNAAAAAQKTRKTRSPSPSQASPAVEQRQYDNPFADIFDDDWYYDNVLYAYHEKLMNGTNSEPMLFSPEMELSRGMSVTVLWRLAGSPGDARALQTGQSPFADVTDDAYYFDAVMWAVANKIAGGYGEGLFGPDDNITREQMAALLYRYELFDGIPAPGGTAEITFGDQDDIGEWAADAVLNLATQKIINGKPHNLFDPQGNATRAEFAAVLHRFCEYLQQKEG